MTVTTTDDLLVAYAAAYNLPADDVRAWFNGLDAEHRAAIVEGWSLGRYPRAYAAQVAYNEAMTSFGALIMDRVVTTDGGAP